MFSGLGVWQSQRTTERERKQERVGIGRHGYSAAGGIKEEGLEGRGLAGRDACYCYPAVRGLVRRGLPMSIGQAMSVVVVVVIVITVLTG